MVAAALAEQRENVSGAPSASAMGQKDGVVARSTMQMAGLGCSQWNFAISATQAPGESQQAPSSGADSVKRKSPGADGDDNSETGQRRGRSTLTQDERRERRWGLTQL